MKLMYPITEIYLERGDNLRISFALNDRKANDNTGGFMFGDIKLSLEDELLDIVVSSKDSKFLHKVKVKKEQSQ